MSPENKDISVAKPGEGESRLPLLEQQQYTQRTWLFRFTLGVIIFLYASFWGVLLVCHVYPTWFATLSEHRYFICIPSGLLLIPSCMLWGLVRAVYNISSKNTQPLKDISSTLKTVASVHPLG